MDGLAASPMTPGRFRPAMLRRVGMQIEPGAKIQPGVQIPFATDVTIGAQSFINYGCILEGKGAIHIGKRVQLAVGVALLTSTHEIGGPEQRAGRLATAPITIGDGAWVGARSLVFPGVTVGAGAIVAAGSVVRQDVEPNTVVGGVPARLLRRLDAVPAPEGLSAS